MWYRVTRHPQVFHGLTIGQRTPGFWGVTETRNVVSRYATPIGIPQVDGWSTGPRGLGHHKSYLECEPSETCLASLGMGNDTIPRRFHKEIVEWYLNFRDSLTYKVDLLGLTLFGVFIERWCAVGKSYL